MTAALFSLHVDAYQKPKQIRSPAALSRAHPAFPASPFPRFLPLSIPPSSIDYPQFFPFHCSGDLSVLLCLHSVRPSTSTKPTLLAFLAIKGVILRTWLGVHLNFLRGPSSSNAKYGCLRILSFYNLRIATLHNIVAIANASQLCMARKCCEMTRGCAMK